MDLWRPLRSTAHGWRLLGVGRNGKINRIAGRGTRAPISAGHSTASRSKSSCEVGQLQSSTRACSMAGQRAAEQVW